MMSKKRKYFVVHWSATPAGRDVTIQDLHRWHIINHGWSRYGYSDLIQLDGTIVNVTPYDSDSIVQQHEMTWGARGINAVSRHICVVGGPQQNISTKQLESLLKLVNHEIKDNPDVIIIGHRQANATQCPGFDVADWLKCNNVPEKHIKHGIIDEYNA